MIKIGVVNIDVSHPLAFSDYLVQGQRARYSAIYNDGFRGDDEVESFMKKYGVEKRCGSIAELAECVDVGFVQSCNWDKHLEQAMPFIDAGKPVFIDKPIVGNLKDCLKLEGLSQAGNVILGSSSVRHAQEIEDFLNMPLEERGEVLNVFGTSGIDEFNYSIHIVEAFGALVASPAVSGKFVGSVEKDGQVCETYSIKFEDGTLATYNAVIGNWHPFEVVVMTTKSTYRFQIDVSKVYGRLLDRICGSMETGKNELEAVSRLTESVKAMLACRLSKERGGLEVELSDIPAADPGYDGGAFEKDYAANARKIYL